MNQRAPEIHSALLSWYEREKRALPWRKNRDPYRVWLSEIMLQQTRVETVIPYFERFLSHFPTVRDLAEAELDTVTNLWAGLGYYSRARNLHACARQICENFAGEFPSTPEQLLSLKGIGPYTAAAIASISFEKAVCALDGNLERVFSRITAERGDPKSEARASLMKFGNTLVRLGSPGSINQAVMDLASAHCRPQIPDCSSCPLSQYCQARKLGIQKELPWKKAKAEKVMVTAQAWAVVSHNALLLARRPAGEWLAGMWDLPWSVRSGGTECARAPFGEERGTCSVTRTITKHKITFEVRGVHCDDRPNLEELPKLCAKADEFRWVSIHELHGVHLPRPSEKALEKILPELK